jgi:NAD(P)-dependent dehydrogenase (short-subunit alcohol dehydrogenase family)
MDDIVSIKTFQCNGVSIMDKRKVVIITGASGGVGAATACWMGKDSATVVLVARSKDRLDEVAHKIEQLGGTALVIPADVSDPIACQNIVDTTLKYYKEIHALINNAGIISPLTNIEHTDIDQWRYTFQVNLLGPFYLTRFALPSLINTQGRIINVSSGAARTPISSASAYCASKAALTHFNRVLAEEVSDVTAISVRPGVVDTPMQAQIRQEGLGVMNPKQYTYYADLKSKNQLEPPEIPARSIAWLALHAPHNMSGEFRNYNDPDIAVPALSVYGSTFGIH